MEKNLESIDIKNNANAHLVDVAEVTDAGVADVYNMTVDNSHAYVANGMVCHNCDAMRYLVQDIGRDVPSVGSLGD